MAEKSLTGLEVGADGQGDSATLGDIGGGDNLELVLGALAIGVDGDLRCEWKTTGSETSVGSSSTKPWREFASRSRVVRSPDIREPFRRGKKQEI